MKYIFAICIFVLASFAWLNTAYALTEGVVVGERVNVRAYAEINSTNRIAQVTRGQIVEIIYEYGDFFRVNLGDNQKVYIAREFVHVTNTEGIVIGSDVSIFDLPAQAGGVATVRLFEGATLTVVGYFENWYAISFFDDIVFVEGVYISIPSFAHLQPVRLPGDKTIACEIIALAMQYMGVPYRWGGNGPNSFDCSGFMVYILRPFDITVNRQSSQMAHNGFHVNRSALEPGDLVFFSSTPGGSRITHVGMYIGGNQFIHASTSCGVRLDSMYNRYFSPRFVTARRVINQ